MTVVIEESETEEIPNDYVPCVGEVAGSLFVVYWCSESTACSAGVFFLLELRLL